MLVIGEAVKVETMKTTAATMTACSTDNSTALHSLLVKLKCDVVGMSRSHRVVRATVRDDDKAAA